MPRREFPKSVRVEVVRRATRDSVVYCEHCGLPAKKWQVDHIRPDGLLGEPVLANAMLICDVCYGIKNPIDTTNIARAKRREAAHLGVKMPKAKIPQRPKVVREKREKLALPPRRSMFQ